MPAPENFTRRALRQRGDGIREMQNEELVIGNLGEQVDRLKS